MDIWAQLTSALYKVLLAPPVLCLLVPLVLWCLKVLNWSSRSPAGAKAGGLFEYWSSRCPPGPITPGSVVMLLLVNGQAPTPPTGYTFKGYSSLAATPSGGGQKTSYAVYAKN